MFLDLLRQALARGERRWSQWLWRDEEHEGLGKMKGAGMRNWETMWPAGLLIGIVIMAIFDALWRAASLKTSQATRNGWMESASPDHRLRARR